MLFCLGCEVGLVIFVVEWIIIVVLLWWVCFRCLCWVLVSIFCGLSSLFELIMIMFDGMVMW